ncbi:MAG: PIN domain-containing protein [Acidobacteria bacterium]|nr:PIN domain-containing protein [Acidobacteriota bacterium]
MIVDPSALLAVVFAESDGEELAAAPIARMSSAGYVEASIRLDQLMGGMDSRLDQLIELMGIVVEPVTFGQAKIARAAYLMYGKGNHPAKLNYGDCFSYALAKVTGEPLLFKGNDFSQTDIVCASS